MVLWQSYSMVIHLVIDELTFCRSVRTRKTHRADGPYYLRSCNSECFLWFSVFRRSLCTLSCINTHQFTIIIKDAMMHICTVVKFSKHLAVTSYYSSITYIGVPFSYCMNNFSISLCVASQCTWCLFRHMLHTIEICTDHLILQ